LRTVFLTHAKPDHDFARQLANFLEFGCEVRCYADEGLIGPGQDLIAKSEEGLSADVLLLMLSPAACPRRWVRERWEPVLFDQARQGGVDVVTLLLEECSFPPLLRRRNFIDAVLNRTAARRLLKRWFWQREQGAGAVLSSVVSADLEDLYSALADQAGTLRVGGEEAVRFAREAVHEFEAVLWVPCAGRTLAQAAGELGNQLGLTLDGPPPENCRSLGEFLAARRCLVVLDAPDEQITRELTAGGRASTAVTTGVVRTLQTPESPAYARGLLAARRYAEAYELLYRLLDAVVEPDWCARELTWICERWDRIEEANVLRLNYTSPGGEQLRLF
jgi:hypothetical protein